LGTDDIDSGWREVERRLERLRRAHDHELYTANQPVTA
jgi:hypothetical protein